MTGGLTADTTRVTADSIAATADGRADPLTCPGLGAVPPSVSDRQASPTADDLLPQILALTPRGPAWGTDEAGDGSGASPVQRGVWRAVAAWAADHLTRDFGLASQVFPSAITSTLPDWEAELGLPDPCGIAGDAAARVAAVRARFGGLGPVSPNDFRCLAVGLGHAVRIEEPRQFRVDTSACVAPDIVETWFAPDASRLDGSDVGETYFACDAGACDGDPLEGFVPALAAQGDPIEGFRAGTRHDPGDEVAGRPPVETYFACDEGSCDGDPLEQAGTDDPNGSVRKFFVLHLASGGDTYFACDEGTCDGTPIEGFVRAPDLECLIRSATPPHARSLFAYHPAT